MWTDVASGVYSSVNLSMLIKSCSIACRKDLHGSKLLIIKNPLPNLEWEHKEWDLFSSAIKQDWNSISYFQHYS